MEKVEEYTELFRDFSDSYLDIPSIIFGGLKYAFLAFVISVILLAILRRAIFVKRVNRFLNALKYTYILLIPALFISIFFAYGALSTVKSELNSHLIDYEKAVSYTIDKALDSKYIALNGTINTSTSLEEQVEIFIPTIKANIIESLSKTETKVSDGIIEILVSTSFMDRYIKDKVKTLISEKTGVEKGFVNDVFTMPLESLLSPALIVKYAHYHVIKIADSIFYQIVAIPVVILFLIFVEVIVANIKNRALRKEQL